MPDLSTGTGLSSLLTYIFAVFGVLAALGIVLWVVRRSSSAAPTRKSTPARRLAVVDQIPLDEKRRLVLVQRDGVQHLVILGGANELLVEGGIVEGRAARRDWEVAALESERELPAFPAAPGRDPASRDGAAREPQPRHAAPRRAPEPLAEPVFAPSSHPAAREGELRVAGTSPPAADVRLGSPPRMPTAAPFEAPPARAPRRPEPSPLSPAATAAAAAITAAAAAEAERARMASAPERVTADAPAAYTAESGREAEPVLSRGGGLLARLSRKRPAEPVAVAPPLPDLAPDIAVDEQGAFSTSLPETPDHATFEPPLGAPPVVTGGDFAAPPVELSPSPAALADAPVESAAATRAEPDMSKLFDMITPGAEPSPDRAEAVPRAEPEPVASPHVASPHVEPAMTDAVEAPRATVKIDPFFASMAQRLEETLRRPLNPPLPPPSAGAAPARPADPVEPAPVAPPAPQPPSPPAGKDTLELEMASLLGRGTQR